MMPTRYAADKPPMVSPPTATRPGLTTKPSSPLALAHPRALRHGFALRYLANDGTLARLQQFLGYEDIATTARYLAAVDERRAPAPRDPWAR